MAQQSCEQNGTVDNRVFKIKHYFVK